MTNFEKFFEPLGKEYCVYFYYLSVIGFVFFWLMLLSGVYMGLMSKAKPYFYVNLLLGSLAYGLIYFKSRLLYSMCVN
jgi:hypothetical protein